MTPNAEDLAYGRWPDILMAAGLDSKFFNGRAGPCPLCGGTDRYRWNQKKGPGLWVCNQCTEGKYASGFALLIGHMGYRNFREAADHVRSFYGENSAIKPVPRQAQAWQREGMDAEQVGRNRARMLRFWNEAKEVRTGDPVWRYLSGRVAGLDFIPSMVRYHEGLAYYAPPAQDGERPQLLGYYPAMLAYAQDAKGDLVQLHKTYLTAEGGKADVPIAKKTDLGVGINAFAVRAMAPKGDTLGVCEGIETGLAAAMLRRVPVWPCLNGPAMAQFELPAELRGVVKRLIVFADHDELKRGSVVNGVQKFRRPGSFYAEQLIQRCREQGLRAVVIKPAKVGADMADHWGAV